MVKVVVIAVFVLCLTEHCFGRDKGCFCTYNNTKFGTLSFSGEQRLSAGDIVPVGTTIKFLCWHHLWYHLVGSTELQCLDCNEWSQAEYPPCAEPNDGEAHIVWSHSPILRLQSNGSLIFTPGKDYTFHCSARIGGHFPFWRVPERADVTIQDGTFQIGGKMMGVSALKISKADSTHIGTYKCEGGTGNGKHLEMIKGPPGCGRVPKPYSSRLVIEPDKEFYVLGQSYTFSCPPGYVLNSDVGRVFCLNGGWSLTTFPECNEYTLNFEE